MIAGQNCKFDIWRMTMLDDDSVGGAQVSGSVVYQNIPARFQQMPEQQLLLHQGLETERFFTANIVPGTLEVYERDEVEVVAPSDHQYYGDRFRVVGRRWADFPPRDPRNYMMLTLTRSVRAHDEQ